MAQARPTLDATQRDTPQSRPIRHTFVYFEYIGKTALTVLGSITGKRYRFTKHSERVAVDLKDRLSLVAVPNLRQVLGP